MVGVEFDRLVGVAECLLQVFSILPADCEILASWTPFHTLVMEGLPTICSGCKINALFKNALWRKKYKIETFIGGRAQFTGVGIRKYGKSNQENSGEL
jgi:hypothetical protein